MGAVSLTCKLSWISKRAVERALRVRYETRPESGRRKRAPKGAFHHPDSKPVGLFRFGSPSLKIPTAPDLHHRPPFPFDTSNPP